MRIRRPDLFSKLPAFDQIGLMMGHEVIQAKSHGKIGRPAVGNTDSDSRTSRQLNAWIALASPQQVKSLKNFRPYRPERTVECFFVSPTSRREYYTSDHVNFKLYITKTNSVLEMEEFRDRDLFLPTYAIFKVPSNVFEISKDSVAIVSFGAGEALIPMTLSERAPIKAELLQVEPDITQLKTARAGLTVELNHGDSIENRIYVTITSGNGQVIYLGGGSCYARATKARGAQ